MTSSTWPASSRRDLRSTSGSARCHSSSSVRGGARIGCLIIYSFAGMQWRAAAPYLAAALTVGLQIWRRNPLLSIIAGTAAYMALLRLM